MNFTAIFCCYVLVPYFASIVSPPQEATTCYAGLGYLMRYAGCCFIPLTEEGPSEEDTKDKNCVLDKNLEFKYFNQKRDHFHHSDSSEWQQRYMINDHYYGGNGIIFIQIGTDENITDCRMQNGRWIRYCANTNALCVGIERRGFGKSLPNGNLKGENLKYLDTEQALADVAWFIHNFRDLDTKYSLPETLKWVAYGWAEEGALAAWLRMKYPHLVHAALSLSAPLLAKKEYDDYFTLIKNDMLDTESDFMNEINNAYIEMRDKYINMKKFKELGKIFNFCDKNLLVDDTTREKNIQFMYFIFAQTVAEIIQYGNDDLAKIKNKAFQIMSDTKESPIKKFAKLIKSSAEAQTRSKCLQMNYQVAMNGYKVTDDGGYKNLDYLLPEILGNRASLYHHCFEYGRFETFKGFFGTSVELDFFEDFCNNVFENIFNTNLLENGIHRTNVFYGGLSIVVSRVIFVYGSDDPYRNLGVFSRPPANSVTHILGGAKHCYELDKYKSKDPSIDMGQDDIYIQLKDWINLS